MPKSIIHISIFVLIFVFVSCDEEKNNIVLPSEKEIPLENQKPCNPLPTPQQVEWQRDRLGIFIHFGINTFTGNEWGDGTDDPALFNPTQLDARQWVRTAKDAGFKLIVFTAKHHDGFCLWQTEHTDYSLKQSSWKNGQGDVVKEVADACVEFGVKFGFYLSPWDRHDQRFGTPAYDEYYMNQLRELLTNYGPVTEIWMDGVRGKGVNGTEHFYQFGAYHNLAKELQPDVLIAIMGPDIHWVGNEDGFAHEDNSSVYLVPPPSYLAGETIWYPTECDVSIRPGWFWRASEDNQVKSPDELFDIYFKSVGNNSNLLLNIPPDNRGLFHQNDIEAVLEMKVMVDEMYKTNLAQNAVVTNYSPGTVYENGHSSNLFDQSDQTSWMPVLNTDTEHAFVEFSLGAQKKVNVIRLEEDIRHGESVAHFTIEAYTRSGWETVASQTVIGTTNLIPIRTVEAASFRFTILKANCNVRVTSLALYYDENVNALIN